jgi:hypothetical protein
VTTPTRWHGRNTIFEFCIPINIELSNNKKRVNVSRALSAYEQETIISFNKDEDIAHIFTYEKTWQKHLEEKLRLKPVMDNGFNGKDYELPKSRIKPHKAHRRLYKSTKK